MIHFITYREPDEKGELQYYILQKEFPHFIGRLVNKPIEGAIINSAVPSYNLWITFNFTLRGNVIPSYKNIITEIEIIYSNMANWFHNERILLEEKKFYRFKIKK